MPCIFDQLWKVDKKCVMLVVSPLIALMQDQVKAITAMGMSAVQITDKEVSMSTEKEKLKNAEFQIIFISPEALVGGMEWRSMLATNVYQSRLIAFVVDEADCIKKW